MVKRMNKSVELRLLLNEVRTGRPRGLQLWSTLHAFMSTVLLRMAGSNPLDGDAEAKPPNSQPTQVEQTVR